MKESVAEMILHTPGCACVVVVAPLNVLNYILLYIISHQLSVKKKKEKERRI